MKTKHVLLSRTQVSKVLQSFLLDDTAVVCAERTGVHRNTVNRWYRYFRTVIFEHQSKLVRLTGDVEIDDHLFFTTKRKRYAKDRVIPLPMQRVRVLGLLQRGADSQSHVVFAQAVSRADRNTILPIIRYVVAKESAIFTDMWRAFGSLQLEGYTMHVKVNHRRKEYVRQIRGKSAHTGTIDQFWGWCDYRLAKFNGIHRHTFPLHMQECAFRYTHKRDLEAAFKKVLRAYESRAH